MTEQDIFTLAKLLHDSKKADCYITKERIKQEQDRFPTDLTPRNYTVPQTDIDIALAQARTVYKHYALEKKD